MSRDGFTNRNIASTLRQNCGSSNDLPSSGVPGAGVEEVNGNRLDFKLPQFKCEIHDIAMRFPHANDAAAAGIHPGVLHTTNRIDAIPIAVRRGDFRESPLARLQIVIESVHP